MQYGLCETIDVFQHLRDLELSDLKLLQAWMQRGDWTIKSQNLKLKREQNTNLTRYLIIYMRIKVLEFAIVIFRNIYSVK